MSILSRNTLRKLILDEINNINECGCKEEVDDPAVLIPEFPYGDLIGNPQFKMITDYEIDRHENALNSKCPGSYAKTADQLIVNPEFAASVIDLLMKKSGSTCPQSSARALSDVIDILQNQ